MVRVTKVVLTDEQRANVTAGLQAGRKVPGNKITFMDDFNQDSKDFLKKTFGEYGVSVVFEESPKPETDQSHG